ncbi:MAG: hypothetical protein JWL60_201 [Gemmatimonadetes bacterium]|jgi:hypothetical protein|nr:hypothetical protein [Gemmatimonadota bacterium]
MRSPTLARPKYFLLTSLAALSLLGACSEQPAGPALAGTDKSQARTSPFVPSEAAKALIGVANGTYVFTVDPSQHQEINLGPNHLSIPANAICDIARSSYGAGTWNDACAPQRQPVVITAIVRNAESDHPSIDFYPAMRFSPDKAVNLHIYVPVDAESFRQSWVMKYCNDFNICVDESLADVQLRSYVDSENKVVFRRIKHFSGFIINNFLDDAADAIEPLF